MEKNYLTTREAARILGVSLRTAQQWQEKGELDGWKTEGGHRRITRSSVTAAQERIERDAGRAELAPTFSVLVVEDDPTFLTLYRLQIAKWPFEATIYTAPNGYEGLVMVGEVVPHLLICDLRLPGVNGFQIVRSLCNLERYRDMAIVVVSSMAGEEVEAHGGLPSGVEFMSKPIDFTHLQTIAEGLWARSGQA